MDLMLEIDIKQRHTSPTHVTVSRNNYLVVRHVATVGVGHTTHLNTACILTVHRSDASVFIA